MVLSLPNGNAIPNLFEWFSTNVAMLVVIWISIHSAYATWWRRHYEATLEFMTGWCPTSTLFILHYVTYDAGICLVGLTMPMIVTWLFILHSVTYDAGICLNSFHCSDCHINMWQTLVGICCKRARCFITDWFSAISHGLRLADLWIDITIGNAYANK